MYFLSKDDAIKELIKYPNYQNEEYKYNNNNKAKLL